jgi:hypothetical protein
VSGVSSGKAEHPAAAPFAKAWNLSPEEWLAYEQDMAAADDYERWIAEMEEAEAGDASKQTADLKMINNPF